MGNSEGQQQFMLTEKQLTQYAVELIQWGKDRNLQPAELALVILSIGESIAEQLGLVVHEAKITDLNQA